MAPRASLEGSFSGTARLPAVLGLLGIVLLSGSLWFSPAAAPPSAVPSGPETSGSSAVGWWNPNYLFRQPITIASGSAAVLAGYSVPIRFDHASLVAEGKARADGDDVRLANWSGTDWVELDRVLDLDSSWNDGATTLWFRTQAPIAATSSDSHYYLHYGNPAAINPPADPTRVFDLWEEFNDTSQWSVFQDDADSSPQSVSAVASGGILTVNAGGSLVAGLRHLSYAPGNTVGFAARTRARSLAPASDDIAPACWFINAPTGQSYCYESRDGRASRNRNRYIRKHASSFPDGDDTNIQIDSTTGPFPVGNTWYTYEVERLPNGRIRALRDGRQQFPPTAGTWSVADTALSSGGFGLGGESQSGESYQFDWISSRKLVDPEPAASLGCEETSAPAPAPPSGWWNNDFPFRRRLTVTTGTACVPAGYSVPVSFDHMSLVAASKAVANGDDVRLVHWDGSGWVELDRVLDTEGAWNQPSTRLWFRLQRGIPADSSDNHYYLHYGNPAATGPPANAAQVFDLFDSFASLADWRIFQDDADSSPQAVSVTLSDGVVTIDAGGALLAGLEHRTYTPGNSFGFAARTRARSLAPASDDIAPTCWFINAPTGETYCYESRDGRPRRNRNRYIRKHDSSFPDRDDTNIQFDSTTGPFAAPDVWYVYEVQRRSDGSMRAFRNGLQQFPPVASTWSLPDTAISSGGFGFGGESLDGEDYQFDWIWSRKLVLPEPTTALGEEERVVPVPVLTSMDPDQAPVGSGPLGVTLRGREFVAGAVARFGDTALATSFTSFEELAAEVPAELLATVGVFPVTVLNPAPGGGTSNALPFTVFVPTPVVIAVIVTPQGASIRVGETQQFRAHAQFPDGSLTDVTDAATWSSSNLDVATVEAGLAQAVARGRAIITAAFGGRSGDATLEVRSAEDGLPPDPSIVAPPIDPTVATTIGAATEFLYTGEDPIQTGVAPGTIEPRRAAVLRGKVLTREGAALPGVRITVLGHPEFGQTLSRADGAFDMAVNGGGVLTVRYEKEGFLTAQRQLSVPWQDYALLPDVVMIPLDSQVTPIDLSAPIPIQVARGNPVTDEDPTRQATLLFPQGTTATMTLPDGTTQPLTNLSVRATEYTVGPNGPKAMPAELPPTSGYTYAVEFSVDEALAAGATDVQFSQPVINYTENFLNFPIGMPVPAGFYDRKRAAWVPSDDGRVIQILSITGGLADVDTDGDGVPDTGVGLGINDAERQQLAALYLPGQILWRVAVTHFTPWDWNWPIGLPPDAIGPEQPGPRTDKREDKPCRRGGSIIECQNQTLGEAIGITGTPFRLHYQSDRVPGRTAGNALEIPISGASLPASLNRIELDVSVGGQQFTQTLPPTPNQKVTFMWDGRDAYGRTLQGAQPFTTRIGYVYPAFYHRDWQQVRAFSLPGLVPTGSRTRREFTVFQEHYGTLVGANDARVQGLGGWDARGQGLGSWTLDVHHTYDPLGQMLYLGDGSRRSTGAAIKSVAGGGDPPDGRGDGGPATAARLFPLVAAVGPDGSFYIGDVRSPSEGEFDTFSLVRRVRPDGVIGTVAGGGEPPDGLGDGGPATDARLNVVEGLAIGPDGGFYIADADSHRIRRVGRDGVITTVAGSGTGGFSGDGGPATAAELNTPRRLAVDGQGNLFIADSGNHRIRKVGRDGIIVTVAGNGEAGYSGDGGPATAAMLNSPFSVSLDAQGRLYIADTTNHRVRKVDTDGTISTVAGTGAPGFSGDGGPATSAQLVNPLEVALDRQGTFFIADGGNRRIRRVDAQGVILTVAGGGSPPDGLGDGGPGINAALFARAVVMEQDGSLLISDSGHGRVRELAPTLPPFTSGEIAIPSEDGSELYMFSPAGKHLRTLNALTGAVVYEFIYDANGLLTEVEDGDGNITLIERDASGNPTAVIAPFGQRTELGLDANGYLNRIADPAGNAFDFTYSGAGLLETMTDPRRNTWRFTYDALGRLIREDDPAGGFVTLARTENPNGHTVTLTTALGRINTYTVENLPTGGSRRVNTDPSGLQSVVEIGTDGSRTVTSPDGTVTTLTEGPDPRFGMQAPIIKSLTVRTPGGLQSTLTTNRTVTLANPANPLSLTLLTDIAAINGRTYTNRYDASLSTFTATQPTGRRITTHLDPRGRPVGLTLGDLEPLSFAYDANGRLASVTQGKSADARASTVSHDSLGRVSNLTDPQGRSMSFIYDATGRVVKQTLPDGREARFSYDVSGNVSSIVPPGRPAHSFSHSSLNLEQEYIAPDVGTSTNLTTYSYNLDRQLTRITRPGGDEVGFRFDSDGRLATVAVPTGHLSFSYESDTGRLSTISSTDGSLLSYIHSGALLRSETWAGSVTGTVTRSYDNNFRMISKSVEGSNPVAFAYDADGLIIGAGGLSISRDSQNGLVTGTAIGNVTTTQNSNSFGEPQSYRVAFLDGEFFAVQYVRDKLGRIVHKTETIDRNTFTFAYDYDLAGRLTDVTRNGTPIAHYEYDLNGNRLSHGGELGNFAGTYDAQDRLLQYGNFTYTYNPSGELETKTNTATNQTTTYDYDSLGNLISVSLPDGTQVEYTVDGQNRRIGKKVNGALVQGFLYGGSFVPIAELDSNSEVMARFVYATKGNSPDYLVKSGIIYRILSDHLGSPRMVVNVATGTIVQRMDYDEFGNVVFDSNPGFQPFGFAGGLYDQDSKLTRFGARDYDALVGRWTTKDPIRFASADQNLYAYALNDPVNLVDPSGMVNEDAIGGCPPDNPVPQKPKCRPPGFFPRGFGLLGSYNLEGGVWDTGAISGVNLGAGAFFDLDTGASPGAFLTHAATAFEGPHQVGIPDQDPNIRIAEGAFIGAGVGLFLTNARSVHQLGGLSTTWTGSVGGGQGASIQISKSQSGVWIFSITVGPGFGGVGSAVTTNTFTAGPGCR